MKAPIVKVPAMKVGAARRAVERFYPSVDSAVWVERLIPCGARSIRLSIEDRAEEDARTEVRAALEICRRHGARLVVHGHWRVAVEEGCGFVHLGRDDLAAADLEALRGARIKLGVDTHDPADLERALAADPDYIALGPIYPTEAPRPALGIERIVEWRRRAAGSTLVAAGGLTPERAKAALAAGADSAAVSADIVRHPQPELRAREWAAAVEPAARGLIGRVRARRA